MREKVHIDLYARWAAIKGDYPEELSEELRYRDPGAFFKGRFSRWGNYSGWKNMINRHRIPAGLFLAMRDELEEKLHIKFKVREHRHPPKYHKHRHLKSDRKYQNKAVEKMMKCHSGGIVHMATGVGKTYIAALYFSRLKGSGIFIVDELTLLHQAKDEIEKMLGEKVGIVGESKFRPERITVATIQTLHIHRADKEYKKWSKGVDVVLIDEFHIAINHRSRQTLTAIQPKLVFGLTATLEMTKKDVRMKALSMAGKVCYSMPIEAGQREGVLSKGVAISVQIRQAETEPARWPIAYQNIVVKSKPRQRTIVALVKECYNRGKAIVVLVERIPHLKDLSNRLEDIPHRLVYGAKSVEDRIKAKKDFQKGKLRVILTNKVFKKGINIPAIDVIVDAAASKSKNDAVQKYGRGIRISEGKRGLIYFDISDRSPEGLTTSDPGSNRFSKATGSRLRALKAAGIAVHEIEAYPKEWDSSGYSYSRTARTIYKFGEKKLDKVLRRKHGKSHSSSS